jgi:hypothetical protein
VVLVPPPRSCCCRCLSVRVFWRHCRLHGSAANDVPVIEHRRWQAFCSLPRPVLVPPHVTIFAAFQPLVRVKVKPNGIVTWARRWRPIERRRVWSRAVLLRFPRIVRWRSNRLLGCRYDIGSPTQIYDVPVPCTLVLPVRSSRQLAFIDYNNRDPSNPYVNYTAITTVNFSTDRTPSCLYRFCTYLKISRA